MAKIEKKKPGYYWVKLFKDTNWTIGEVEKRDRFFVVFVIGVEPSYDLDEIYEWGEKIPERKQC